MAEFLVVECPSTFNALLGWLSLKALKAITSVYHLTMKFLTPEGVGVVNGSQVKAKECYTKSVRIVDKNKRHQVQTMMVGLASSQPKDIDPREPQEPT